ncbi:MAG TPA: succinylglutamate desuccinylase/aspartoacylase family protein [Baekduia sp.]|nr:succinylglutamate desuccinylase/aspartoacylase family protein [Baekduia sp.]
MSDVARIVWRPSTGSRRDGRLAAAGQDLPIIELRGAHPGPTLGLVAGVHGDEVECIDALVAWLQHATIDRGRILAVPVCHPAALAAGTRLGPDGVDLNRVFPGDGSGRPTERLAQAVAAHVLPELDLLLTLHSWSRGGDTVTYVEYPRSERGEAVAARSRELAHAVGAPYAEAWDWPEGLLPAAAVRAGVPAAELEVGGLGRATSAGRADVFRALDGAVRHAELRERPDGGGRPTEVQRHWLSATAEGRAAQRRERGAAVVRGDVVAEVLDLDGRCLQQLHAPDDGVVAIHVTYGRVEPGDPVAVLFAPDRRENGGESHASERGG